MDHPNSYLLFPVQKFCELLLASEICFVLWKLVQQIFLLLVLFFEAHLFCTSYSGKFDNLLLKLGFDLAEFSFVFWFNIVFKLLLQFLILDSILPLDVYFSLLSESNRFEFDLFLKLLKKLFLHFLFSLILFELQLPFLNCKFFIEVCLDALGNLSLNFTILRQLLVNLFSNSLFDFILGLLLNFGFEPECELISLFVSKFLQQFGMNLYANKF